MYALFVVDNPTRIIFRKNLKVCFLEINVDNRVGGDIG